MILQVIYGEGWMSYLPLAVFLKVLLLLLTDFPY